MQIIKDFTRYDTKKYKEFLEKHPDWEQDSNILLCKGMTLNPFYCHGKCGSDILVVGNDIPYQYVLPNIRKGYGNMIISDTLDYYYNETKDILLEKGYKIKHIGYKGTDSFNPFKNIDSDYIKYLTQSIFYKYLQIFTDYNNRKENRTEQELNDNICRILFVLIEFIAQFESDNGLLALYNLLKKDYPEIEQELETKSLSLYNKYNYTYIFCQKTLKKLDIYNKLSQVIEPLLESDMKDKLSDNTLELEKFDKENKYVIFINHSPQDLCYDLLDNMIISKIIYTRMSDNCTFDESILPRIHIFFDTDRCQIDGLDAILGCNRGYNMILSILASHITNFNIYNKTVRNDILYEFPISTQIFLGDKNKEDNDYFQYNVNSYRKLLRTKRYPEYYVSEHIPAHIIFTKPSECIVIQKFCSTIYFMEKMFS